MWNIVYLFPKLEQFVLKLETLYLCGFSWLEDIVQALGEPYTPAAGE